MYFGKSGEGFILQKKIIIKDKKLSILRALNYRFQAKIRERQTFHFLLKNRISDNLLMLGCSDTQSLKYPANLSYIKLTVLFFGHITDQPSIK